MAATTNRVLGTVFPNAQFTNITNPSTSYAVYDHYRRFAMGLLDTTSSELYYKTFYNEENSFNGEGVHEKFVYRGRSILDLSMGLLDFPWIAADVMSINERTAVDIQQLANMETDPVIAPKLRAIANFISSLPPYTRVYYYSGADGTRAITISDEFNGVKFNYELTYKPTNM